MKTSKILSGAADYLERYGHSRNESGKHGGPRCIIGAISSATSMDDEWADVEDKERAWNFFRDSIGGFITVFNQRESLPTILQELREAAGRAAEEGK